MAISGKEFLTLLEENGWKSISIEGSHHKYRKDNVTITVPVHGSKNLKVGLLAALRRQTGIDVR